MTTVHTRQTQLTKMHIRKTTTREESTVYSFEVRHPRCVSNKSNCKVYAYIVKHNYVLSGMLFTIRKAQLHVSAISFGHHHVVQ